MEHRTTYPTLSFEKWIRGIINNALIDELRSLPSFSRSRGEAGRQLVRRVHLSFEEEQHVPSRIQSQVALLDVRRILRCIRDAEFPVEQRRALLLWIHGHSIPDCARELDLDEVATRRVLRAARQRLRRHFEERNQ